MRLLAVVPNTVEWLSTALASTRNGARDKLVQLKEEYVPPLDIKKSLVYTFFSVDGIDFHCCPRNLVSSLWFPSFFSSRACCRCCCEKIKKAFEGRLGANGSLRLFLVAPLLPPAFPVPPLPPEPPEGESDAACSGSLIWTEDDALCCAVVGTDEAREGGVIDRALLRVDVEWVGGCEWDGS